MLKGFLVPVARRSSWLNSLRVVSTTELCSPCHCAPGNKFRNFGVRRIVTITLWAWEFLRLVRGIYCGSRAMSRKNRCDAGGHESNCARSVFVDPMRAIVRPNTSGVT